MTKIREGLAKCRRDYEACQESWLNLSPWLTNLVSTLLSPLHILVMLLTFGLCTLNELVQFIKERLEAIQWMVMWTQYQFLHREIREALEFERVP